MSRYPIPDRARAAAVDLIKMDALGLGEEHTGEITPIVVILATYCLEYGQGISDELRQALLDTLKRFDELRQDVKTSGEGVDWEKRPLKLPHKLTVSMWRTSFLQWATEKFPEVADLVASKVPASCAGSDRRPSGLPSLSELPQPVPLEALVPHPDNPRLAFNDELKKSLAAQMRKATRFEARHAITVRRHGGKLQILSGHTRVEAAKLAGLTLVMAWIVDVSDEEALLLLALDNQQEPLSKLEIALYSFKVIDQRKVWTQETFAAEFHLQASNLRRYRKGAMVYAYVVRDGGGTDKFIGCQGRVEHLATITKAPQGQWGALVMACLAHDWTIAQTERAAEGAARGESWDAPDKLSEESPMGALQTEQAMTAATEAFSSAVDATPPSESGTTEARTSPIESSSTSELASPPILQMNVPIKEQGPKDDSPKTDVQRETPPDAEEDHRRPAGTKLKSAVTSIKTAMVQLSAAGELKDHTDLLHELLAQIQQAIAEATSATP